MKKRYFILAVCFVAFVGIVLGVLAMLPPRVGVTKANFDRIEDTMKKPEIEDIIGQPTDKSSNGLSWHNAHNYKTNKAFMGVGQELVIWGGDDGVIIIVFAEDGRIVRKDWMYGSGRLMGRLFDWLHR
jgi:hypothetical protein